LVIRSYLEKNPLQNFKFRYTKNYNEFIKKNNYLPDQLNQLICSPCSENLSSLRDRILLELAYSTVWTCNQLASILEMSIIKNEFLEIKIQSEIKIIPHLGMNIERLKKYKLLLPNTDERESFWVDSKHRKVNLNQLRLIIRKQLKPIGLDVRMLREVATQQFQRNGADIRSVQKLRNLKKIHRFQSLVEADYDELSRKFSEFHNRNS
jgi:site-specific recombinase XerD